MNTLKKIKKRKRTEIDTILLKHSPLNNAGELLRVINFQVFTDTFEDKWDLFFHVRESNGEIDAGVLTFDFEMDDFILSVGGI